MNEIIKQENGAVQEAQGVRTPETIAAEINYITQKTRETVLSSAIEIGRRLCEAKELVKHGDWERWLLDNVRYSQSTANNLMAVYREYGSDQQSLFDRANSKAIEDLSYSKAVALLVLPREQREEFMEQNPVEEMSTRELQAAIKRAQEAQEQLDTAIIQRQKYQELANNEAARANKLAEEAKKAADELKKAKDARKKADDKAKKLQDQIAALQEMENQLDQQTLDRISAEAEKKAKAEKQQEMDKLQAQLAEVQLEKEKIAKRLETMGCEELIQARLIIARQQEEFNRVMGLIASLKNKGDDENAAKLKSAEHTICEKMTKMTED